MKIKGKSTIQRIVTIFALVAASVFNVVGLAGATTVGANITTAALTATGASTLQAAVTVTSTTNPQLTVQYDSTNYWTEGASSTGLVTFDSVGSALAGAFTFSDPLKVATSTTVTALSVESLSTSNATTTLAVYQFGTGDIVNFYDSSTSVFTIKDGGKVGAGTTTPYGFLSVNAPAGSTSFVVGSSTATLFEINSNGVAEGNKGGWASADLIWQGDANTNLFVVDASADRVGIATTTPYGLLSVNAPAGSTSFVVGSSTATLFEINSNGVAEGNKGGWASADLIWQGDANTNLFVVDASADRVGIATTTPSAQFAVGSSTAATSTIDFAKPCFRMTVNVGGTLTTLYYWPSLVTGTVSGWATSTVSCF